MAQESVRPISGPGHRGPRGPRPKVDNAGKTIRRLMSYVGKYKTQFTVVIICIILSAFANVRGSLFIQTVIDDYIVPMLSSGNNDFSPPAFSSNTYGNNICSRYHILTVI